ncbi:hypothetical protein ACFUJY_29205 [Streptomyces sp. NPDC057249]|uniref:hypothetical protein n=1 Tax=Streptomyces sp. NPDC057249 TaxID=3346067 RepID=UPI003632BF2E
MPSSFGLDEREKAKQFGAYFKALEDRITALERANPLTNASIEGGALDIYDADGTLRAQIGVQDDGTVALAPRNSQPPPTPTAPAVETKLAGLVVAWDGAWADAEAAPADFALVQVHVGPAPDFLPDLTTLAATITAPLGGAATISVEGYAPVWVRLVAANTAAVTGEASTAVQGTPRQAVGDDLVNQIIDETKLAEAAVTEAKIALGAVGSPALAKGAVTLNALGGAVSDLAAQRYVDTMTDPSAWQVLGQAPGAKWELLGNVADARTGQNVGQATGYTALRGTVQIAYDPEVLYRVSVRTRTTVASTTGTDRLYIGVLGLAADGKTYVNRAGENSYVSQHYCAASSASQPAGGGWVTYTGYIQGLAAPGAPGNGGAYPDPRAPGVLHGDVRFISPALWLNFGSGSTSAAGVMQVDAVTIEALKTGVVNGTNLVVGSVATAHLATDSVAAGKIAADAVSAREILAKSITTEKLVGLAVTAEKIAALAITTAKLDALAVTADKLAVNSVTATKIAAGAIEATHIKAGAITAEKIDADALNGKTITGAVIQTAATGNRVLVTNTDSTGVVRFFNTSGDLSADISAGTDRDGMQALVIQGPTRFVAWPSRPVLTLAADDTVGTAILKADRVTFQGSARAPADFIPQTRFLVEGYLSARNIEVGRVRITPTPNVPTSMTVTGLRFPVGSKTFRGVATPVTTVVGTDVKGVSITDQTDTSMTVWVTRTDNAATNIDYIVIAKD